MSRFDVEGFSDRELDYYSRTILLKDMGIKAQRQIKESSICIVGLGGLGSPIAMQLASMGVGRLRLVDGDIVEISNLQRQNLYGINDVGLAKVEVAARRVREINPFIEVDELPLLVNGLNADNIVSDMNVVIGSLDQMTPRYALNRACVDKSIPMVHGAAVAYSGNVSTIIPGLTACLECFQGGVDDSQLPTCAVVGVHPSLVNVVGSIMASEAVRIITGNPVLTDKLLFIDFSDLSFETLQLRIVENCPVCGNGSDVYPLIFEEVKEICGREGKKVFVFQPGEPLNIEINDYVNKIKKINYEILTEGRLGFTFKRADIKGSILKSGIMILEGFKDRESASELYNLLFK